jgi:hypothetical protein
MNNLHCINTALVSMCSRLENKVYNLFTNHPHSQNMTYINHLCIALKLSVKMGYGSFCLFVHSLFPFLYETKGSNIIKELYYKIDNHRPE